MKVTTHKYIRFTGKYSKLKSMGYEFQKLFAGNYMQWGHDELGFRVWKRGAELTIDRFTNHEGALLEYLINSRRDNVTLLVKQYSRSARSYITFYINQQSGEVTTDDSGWLEEFRRFAKSDDIMNDPTLTHDWLNTSTSPEWVRSLMDLYDMGWIVVSSVLVRE